ncbi:sec14p-like phosphatidylinositol transfer family protein [Wolffia australiana]
MAAAEEAEVVAATKIKVKGEDSETKIEVKGEEAEKKIEVKGEDSETKIEVKREDSESKIEVKGEDAEKKIELKGEDSQKKIEVKGEDSEKKIEVKGEDSETKIEVKGEEAETKIEVKGEEAETKIEVKEEEAETKNDAAAVGPSASFKEESNVVADLEDPEKKALVELRKLVEEAIAKNEFSKPPPKEEAAEKVPDGSAPSLEINLWGVPLLADDRTDTVLLKFLRARDFKVKDAFEMIRSTVIWREEFGIEKLLEEDLGLQELEKVVFMSGNDREGHPVCYNVYGEFQDKDLYQNAFSDEEKRKKFLQWRILFLEKGIRQLLDFSSGGVCSMVQVTDLKNSPTLLKKDVRHATQQAVDLLQDNYPEFVAKKVFINVPWWYLAYHRMISPFLTQRTKSKFVFASPAKSAETLFKYIAPEQVPVQFGGLGKENDSDFSAAHAVTEITVKPSSKHAIDVSLPHVGSVLNWELRVLGREVSYGVEFVPSAEDSYTMIIQKTRKYVAAADEPFVKGSFRVSEPGKAVITVDNSSSRKKKLLYRYKISEGRE